MKKNEKILQSAREFTADWLGKLILIMAMIIIVLGEILGIILALEFYNYLVLSAFFYIIVMIEMCYTKRVFFKKLNQRLLEREDLAMVMFTILPIITIALSWNYFLGFILTIINAIMSADFFKVVEVEE